jgi:hypothetical protein
MRVHGNRVGDGMCLWLHRWLPHISRPGLAWLCCCVQVVRTDAASMLPASIRIAVELRAQAYCQAQHSLAAQQHPPHVKAVLAAKVGEHDGLHGVEHAVEELVGVLLAPIAHGLCKAAQVAQQRLEGHLCVQRRIRHLLAQPLQAREQGSAVQRRSHKRMRVGANVWVSQGIHCSWVRMALFNLHAAATMHPTATDQSRSLQLPNKGSCRDTHACWQSRSRQRLLSSPCC